MKNLFWLLTLTACSITFSYAQNRELTESNIKGIALLINDLDHAIEVNNILTDQVDIHIKKNQNLSYSLERCENISISKDEITEGLKNEIIQYQEREKQIKKANRKKVLKAFLIGISGGLVVGILI